MGNSEGEKFQEVIDLSLPRVLNSNGISSLDIENTPDLETPQSEDDSPKYGQERAVHGFKWVLLCTSLYIAAFVYGLDTTIAADIQGSAAATLGHVNQLTWLGSGFPLGSVCVILPGANLYTLFDSKILFIASIIIFETGSALCGAASEMSALIVGRVIAGVGGSGVYIGILTYFSLCTTEKERGAYMGGIGLTWGIGAILGPVIGGLFATGSATWRWAFYINLVIAAVCAPIYLFYLPSLKPTGSQSTVASNLRRIDWVGVVLSVGTIACFSIVFTFAGASWKWNDGHTIAMIVVFVALLTILVIQQCLHILTTPETRLFPPGRVLRSRTQSLLGVGTYCAISNNFLTIYYIPTYFQFVHNDTALMAAVRLLPFIVILITTVMVLGILLPKIKIYAIIYLASGIFMTIGAALMFTVSIDTSAASIYGYTILIAIGAGLAINTGFTIGSIKASGPGRPVTDMQHAVSMQNLWQIGGSMVSLVISGQIFQSYAFRNLKETLKSKHLTDAQLHAAVSGAQSEVLKNLPTELARAAIVAITDAINKAFILGILAGALALVASGLMRWERLFAKTSASGQNMTSAAT